MKRYVSFLLIVSLLFIFIGLITGKISGDSFTYISLTGSLLATLQILYIVMLLMLGVAVTIPALVIDFLLLLLGMSFPLVGATWDIVWHKVTIAWFWLNTSGSSILFSSLILAVISILMLRQKKR